MTIIRVLHVDDDPDIREVVSISFALDPGILAKNCASGSDGLAVVSEWLPDVILLDVMMPVMAGPATLVRLRADPRTAAVPVIFMTARVQGHEVDRFHSLGAIGVISKPFDPLALPDLVRKHLRQGGRDLLDPLRMIFLRRVIEDASMLMKFKAEFEDGTASAATLTEVSGIAHGLAGAGGIFGFCELGIAGAALEDAIIAELAGPRSSGGVCGAFDRLLHCMGAGVPLSEDQSHLRLDAVG
jgi:CheY-like chemotaxis protein